MFWQVHLKLKNRKENSEMKKYSLEQFLNDPCADIGTGLLVTRGSGFCFSLKKTSRWGKNEQGISVLFFGGIGGKLENNELPSHSLHRESLEEVGSDIRIIHSGERAVLMDAESIRVVLMSNNIEKEPLPFMIFRSPRSEAGRKPFTNILTYLGEFSSLKKIRPLDDPALIELNKGLLLETLKKDITVREFKRLGGKIQSRINLPQDGIIKPIGTAIAAVRCVEKETIIEDMRLRKEARELWQKF